MNLLPMGKSDSRVSEAQPPVDWSKKHVQELFTKSHTAMSVRKSVLASQVLNTICDGLIVDS